VNNRRNFYKWFLSGCLAGSGITFAALYYILTGNFFWDATIETKTVSVCPDFQTANPPWMPDLSTSRPKNALLAVPKSLDQRVQIWKEIWGIYPSNVYLLVDERRPWVMYKKVDCRKIFSSGPPTKRKETKCRQKIASAKKRVIKWLRKQKRRPSRKLKKFYDYDSRLAKTAYKNIIMIQGKKDNLEQALERAKPFLAIVETIFYELDIPPAIARVAIIESLCNPSAGSPKGAIGAYQFIEATAKNYLMVEEGVDERLDPIRAGWAAAKYIKELHKKFKSWPLAMTAYNTGPSRLKRLIKKRRTRDLGKIADKGSLNGFGFDGQNYFAQLAAVIELSADTAASFSTKTYSTIQTTEPTSLDEISDCLNFPIDDLLKTNPALTKEISKKGSPIPEGYILAIPDDANELIAEDHLRTQ
jgi:membrane-bound lytic murein transglycosylase D